MSIREKILEIIADLDFNLKEETSKYTRLSKIIERKNNAIKMYERILSDLKDDIEKQTEIQKKHDKLVETYTILCNKEYEHRQKAQKLNNELNKTYNRLEKYKFSQKN